MAPDGTKRHRHTPEKERQIREAARDQTGESLGDVPLRVGFVGYGELGRQISALVAADLAQAELHFFDDVAFSHGLENTHRFDEFPDDTFADFRFYVCLGYKHIQRKAEIIDQLCRLNRCVPSFIHATAFANSTARIGDGSVIYPMCNIDKNVVIGRGVLVNNSVTVSHDCRIGDGCFLSPGAVLSGVVTVGNDTFLGAGVVVSNRISIGSNVAVGAGTVVTRDLPDGCSAIGNPMRTLKSRLRIV